MIRPAVLLVSGATKPAAAFQRAFEDAGMSVRLAPDGLSGMRDALGEPPDLIVLDFAAEDAADVLRARRALRQAGIPLLVLAAGEVASEERPGRRTGVSFLAAPVSPERLAAEASKIAESSRRTRERAGNNAGSP